VSKVASAGHSHSRPDKQPVRLLLFIRQYTQLS